MSFCSRCASPLTPADRSGRCARCRNRRAAQIDRQQLFARRLDHLLNCLRWPRLMLRMRRAGRR